MLAVPAAGCIPLVEFVAIWTFNRLSLSSENAIPWPTFGTVNFSPRNRLLMTRTVRISAILHAEQYTSTVRIF